MASLQGRSPSRSTGPLNLLNKLVSIAAFTLFLGIGWVALCYLKTEVINHGTGTPQAATVASTATSTAEATRAEPEKIEAKKLATPVKLVYSCASDHDYFHTSAHLPKECERSVTGEEAALQRGLKPCPACMKE